MCRTDQSMSQAAHPVRAGNLLLFVRMRISVCTNVSRGEALPTALHLGERRVRVVAIANRWIAHPYQYFEVIAEDGRRFVLRFEPNTSCWELFAVYAAPTRAKKAGPQSSRWKLPFSSAVTAK